jgi:hypothetical protein
MSRSIRIAVAAATLSLVAAAPAAADRKVYFNGVDLADTVVTGQTFEHCQVTFDQDGNVHITAPGLEVIRQPVASPRPAASRVQTAPARPAVEPPGPPAPSRPAPAPPAPSRRATGPAVGMDEAPPTEGGIAPAGGRYFLVSRQRVRGSVQYDVDVFVNGKLVKTVRSDRDPVILEITGQVRRGSNLVRMVARKNLGTSDKRASFSPTDVLEIIIGEGTVANGTVTVRKGLIEYRRNASESRAFTDSLQFTAR